MKDWISMVTEGWSRIQSRQPLIHIIPNTVSAAFVADAVSALGARPLMAVAKEETGEITAHSDALVINLGQLTKEKLEAAEASIKAASINRVPIVLDPVGAGASVFRRQAVKQLMELEWDGIIKGNQAELQTLMTGKIQHQGVDGQITEELVIKPQKRFVYAVTGKEDQIIAQNCQARMIHIKNKAPYTVVGTGCVAGGLCGAFAAVTTLEAAAIGGLAAIGYVMKQANEKGGYGAYKEGLLNELSNLTSSKLETYLFQTLNQKEI